MWRHQNQMLGIGDEGGFGLCRLSPQEKDKGLRVIVTGLKHVIGEDLPPLVLMGKRLTFAHAEHGIEQQHPLFSPWH